MFESAGGLIHATGGAILPFLFVLVVVVFVHELGHFLVGRWCGIRVVAFSIGFGPELFGFDDRHGTRWRFALIPLGGYVKFLGDNGAASTPDDDALTAMTPAERAESFHYQPVWKRAATVAAGPLANFILAVIVFAGISLAYGKQVLAPRIDAVIEGGVAAKAGLKPNDVIVSIGGQPVESFQEMQRIVSTSPGVPLAFIVERGGRDIALTLTPALKVVSTPFGKQRLGMLGVQGSRDPADTRFVRLGPIQALGSAFSETWFIVEQSGAYVLGLIGGTASVDQMTGPIGIAQVAGEVAKVGFVAQLNLIAILSVSIGLMNLLPVPILDGGHLLYFAFEAARGRPLSMRAQEFGFRIGLVFVLTLMLFTTVNDILRRIAS